MPILLLDVELPVTGATGPDLTRYFLVCGLLLATVGGLAVLARRFLTRHMQRRAKERSLQVIDMLPLGGKQKLCVVRCYDRTFLLGLGDREVRSIAELDADDVVASKRKLAGANAGVDPTELEPRVIASFDQRFHAELGGTSPATGARQPARPEGHWNSGEGLLG